MPIKITPYRHKEEAFKFVCKFFEFTKSVGESNEQNGQNKVHVM